jgi:enoyl-CoA hydratase/carnithine racemase
MSYNFLKLRKLREVPAALDDLLNDPQVRVIVFASANEKYFSTGADLKVFDGIGVEGMQEWVSVCHGFVNKMLTFVLHPPMRVWVSRR